MKTTLNIPDDRTNALWKVSEAKTRTQAVNRAIEDFIRRENTRKIAGLAGSVDDFITQDDLMQLREAD